MAKRPTYKIRIQLIQGTLDMMVLQTLRTGPQHGYGIAQAIHTRSAGVLQVETGSLYPALQRLEKQGFLKFAWQFTENKQRAKLYRVTATGRRHLQGQHQLWNQISGAISALMNMSGE